MGLSDLRFAFRGWRRNIALTVVAVLTLIVGLGATTAVFTLLYGIVLNPLRIPEADRVVRIFEAPIARPSATDSISPHAFLRWKSSAKSFQSMSMIARRGYELVGGATPLTVVSARVAPGFFSIMATSPEEGRAFGPDDADAVVVSRSLWRSLFGDAPLTSPTTLRLDGRAVGVIGILPADFAAHSVRQRIPGMGVRIALGALSRDIKKTVVLREMVSVVAGACLGIGMGCWVAPRIVSALYGMPEIDAGAITIVASLLLAASLLACWIPARRAAAVDPLQILRSE